MFTHGHIYTNFPKTVQSNSFISPLNLFFFCLFTVVTKVKKEMLVSLSSELALIIMYHSITDYPKTQWLKTIVDVCYFESFHGLGIGGLAEDLS